MTQSAGKDEDHFLEFANLCGSGCAQFFILRHRNAALLSLAVVKESTVAGLWIYPLYKIVILHACFYSWCSNCNATQFLLLILISPMLPFPLET